MKVTLRSVASFGLGLLLISVPTSFSGCSDSSAPMPGDTQVSASSSGGAAADVTDDELKAMLDEMIEHTKNRHLSPQVNNAWQIVHALLAYGHELKLDDHDRKELVPALSYMLADKVKVKGWDFTIGDKGVEAPLSEGKVGQGHEDQWLGYLSQAGLSLDDDIVVQGKTFKILDLLNQAKWDVRPGMEATWTLMATSKYLPLNETWKARDGSEWSVERLIDMESDQKLSESACGGSHRMYAIASALAAYKATGGELTGGWKKADDKVQDTIRRGREFQQPDGGFSTQFFERSATSGEIQLRINTTGHVFEFLAMAIDDQEIRSPWMRRGAIFLCRNLQAAKDLPLECGGLYHAAHGLIIYRERLFGPRNPVGSDAPPPPTQSTTAAASNGGAAPPPPVEK